MQTLSFAQRGAALKILCLGAHSDDIEIGCGGTLLRLLEENRGAEVAWVVLGASGQRKDEALESAGRFLEKAARKEIVVKSFRDGFFPYMGAEIKEFFEDLKGKVTPDLVLTHRREDLHQDHRLVAELSWNTFRNHLILEYEIAKYEGDLGAPNFFVHLTEPFARKKVQILLDALRSQRGKHWFTEDTFMSLLRLHGLESNAPGRYAEGFHCRKACY